MRFEIVLTHTAVETYEAIFERINLKWGRNTAEKFEAKVFQTLAQISETPLIFKSTAERPNVRQGRINKNCSFFYEVNSFEIQILFFWDNRQDVLIG
ncbi:type II toxin-antitoxin system RelE/ParE family toxin [Dyadobacter diqingensis]|uniref:type II toxin-antitoxin system RelE/ParE family toxin n=1 Tax=Dyadobacter diqingensis TaxID=2938121 RepID=UPI0035B6690E